MCERESKREGEKERKKERESERDLGLGQARHGAVGIKPAAGRLRVRGVPDVG